MKTLFLLLPLLILFGCSSNMSLNPQEQQSNTNTSFATTADGEETVPITDIEPPQLPCESNQTGFVTLRNRDISEVRCRIGSKSITLAPHQHNTIEISYGAYTIEWHRGTQELSQEQIIVVMCETTNCVFGPKSVNQDS